MVGQQIERTIKELQQAHWEAAMAELFPAVQETARRYYQHQTESADCTKRFLRESMWMIIWGLDFYLLADGYTLGSCCPCFDLDIPRNEKGYSQIEDILYYVFDKAQAQQIMPVKWREETGQFCVDEDNELNLSGKIIWGIVLAVVSCESNANECLTQEGQMPDMAGLPFLNCPISALWGQRIQLMESFDAYRLERQKANLMR